MALISMVVWCGQARILRRIFQLLSWSFARSPGPRSRAWAELTAFWFCRKSRALFGVVLAGPTALRDFDIRPRAAVGAVGDDPDLTGRQDVDAAMFAGRAHVGPGAGQRR